MAGWKDTIEDEDKATKSWLESVQDESESVLPSLKLIAETGQDFLTGASQGATLGAADELGGGIAAGVETLLGKLGIGPAAADGEIPIEELPGLSPELKQKLAGQTVEIPRESFLEKYRGYQEAGEKLLRYLMLRN